MLSYLANSILLFLLLATVSESQSSSSTTTVAPVTSTTASSTSSTSASTSSTTSSGSTTTASSTRASNATNGSSVVSITLIKNNVTSNYFLYPFVGVDENFTLPFAINQCSSYNINGAHYMKPVCASSKLLNITFYNNSGCTSKPYRYELVSNISVFRCNNSNNYAELALSPNTSCPGKSKTYVGINLCFPTEYGYASFFCSGNYVQYVDFNASSCMRAGLYEISQVNSTICGPLFNSSIYTSLSSCISNVSTSSSNSSKTNTTAAATSTTASSTASTTASTTVSTTASTTASTTKASSTTGVSTTSSGTTSTSSSSTTKSTKTSSGSRVFILNNIVYILSIVTIFKIIS